MDVLKELFERHFHSAAERIVPVQGQLGSSGRNIVRVANDKHSAIGVVYGVREENVAFLEFSKHFHKHGLPVPKIYAEDLDRDAGFLQKPFTPAELTAKIAEMIGG